MRCLLHDEPCSLQLCHETGECAFPTVCYLSASQPNPTPQELTAPTLEQLAKSVRKAYEAQIQLANEDISDLDEWGKAKVDVKYRIARAVYKKLKSAYAAAINAKADELIANGNHE